MAFFFTPSTRPPSPKSVTVRKSEIRNEQQTRRRKREATDRPPTALIFSSCRFGFVSDFVLRISDLTTRCHPLELAL